MTNVMVTIADTWLTDVANPSVSVHARGPGRTLTSSTSGEVRFYAGGRRRVITTRNRSRSFDLDLRWLSAADVALLDSWQGRVLLLRDGLGFRTFGTFLEMSQQTVMYQTRGVSNFVTMTFTALTYSEAVL